MTVARLRSSAVLLLAFTSTGCVPPRNIRQATSPASTVVRVAELPEAQTSSGTQSDPFANACAMLVRDANSGQEYLLTRSEIRTTSERAGSTTSTSLVRATGEYAPVVAGDREGVPLIARLRVDCTSSRVLAKLPAPNTR